MKRHIFYFSQYKRLVGKDTVSETPTENPYTLVWVQYVDHSLDVTSGLRFRALAG